MPGRSIKTRITVTVCILVIIMQSLLAGVTFLFFKHEFKENISSQQFTLLISISQSIDQKLDHALSVLKSVAHDVPPDIFSDPEAAQKFLDNRPGTRITFDNVLFLLTPQGSLLAESPYRFGRRGKDLSYREYFRKTILSGRPHISDPFISTHSPGSPTIVMTVPIYDGSGRIKGIMCGGINLLGKNILADVARIRIANTGYLYMVTDQGTTIMHPDPSRIMQPHVQGTNILLERALKGFEGTEENFNSKGMKSLTSFKHLSTVDWILGANYPVDEAYQPLRRGQLYCILTIIGGALISIMVAGWAMRRLTRSVSRLANHARGIAKKEGSDRLFPVERDDEIGLLAATLNSMIMADDKTKKDLNFANTHDTLTGLYNRAYFESQLDLVSRQSESAVYIMVADLDGLKECNDTLGHSEGDRLIQAAAEVLRESFRGEDTVARIGGDEFAVILPGITEETMAGLICRINEQTAKKNEELEKYPLAMSVGYAVAEEALQVRKALVTADQRMYLDKKSHRKARKGLSS